MSVGVGASGLLWWARLTGQLLILRLMTRGLARLRRSGLMVSRISSRTLWRASFRVVGGKARRLAGASAGGPEAS